LKLIAEQQAAVDTREGAFAVIASAGSGKTEVLVQRYIKLITSGIQTKDILSLTFTNEASQEMASRAGILDAKSVFRTFHSFCLDLLKKERENVPFKMCDTIIPVEMQNFDLLFRLCKIYPQIASWRTLRQEIQKWKQGGISPEQAMEEANGLEYFTASAYKDYERKCREEGWLDFDSLQEETIKLLETNEEVRDRHKWKYIQVDEAQDCCTSQTRLLQLIFTGNIFLVGDENQLVYAWRGAQPNNLTNSHRKFPGMQKMYLATNFRSTKSLVDFFRKITPVDNGLASRMESINEDGEPPVITKYKDDYEEAEEVLASITDPINTAILARTNRQLHLFQKMCVSKNIKYKILNKRDFFDLNEVKKVLKLAKDHQHEFQGIPAAHALQILISRHRLLDIYKHSEDPMEASPSENINDICKMAAKHKDLPEFLEKMRKIMYARRSAKGLTLSTCHGAKGKGFNTVYLVGCSQGLLPHTRGELSEEARILYVGCTRTKKLLYVSYYGQLSQFLSSLEGV
jgi:superfamily I DNA/RNA helicase